MKKRGWLHRQLQNAAAAVKSLPEWMRRDHGTEGIHMTLKDLAALILALPLAEQYQPAIVWPPNPCPAAEMVPVVSLITVDGRPVISTGKVPA